MPDTAGGHALWRWAPGRGHAPAGAPAGRGGAKRGGDRPRVDLLINHIPAADAQQRVDVIAPDEGLDKLAELNERQAKIVEMRYFSGMTIDETAAALDISPRTVKGDWRLARAWLKRYLDETTKT